MEKNHHVLIGWGIKSGTEEMLYEPFLNHTIILWTCGE